MDVDRISSSTVVLLVGVLSISSVGAARAQSSSHAFVARADEALAADHPGRAILNLERARLLSPSSHLVANDLARARLAARLPTAEPQVTGTSSQLLRTDHWGELALAGLAVAAGALVAMISRLGRRGFLSVALLGGLIATVGFWATIRAEPPPNLAVVISPDVLARIAPSVEAPPLFMPREGTLVSIEGTKAPFVLIGADGRCGWVPTDDVETILPGD